MHPTAFGILIAGSARENFSPDPGSAGDLDAASLGKETQPLPLEDALDTEGGWAPRFAARVVTDFEYKALEAGRRIFDLSYVRTPH